MNVCKHPFVFVCVHVFPSICVLSACALGMCTCSICVYVYSTGLDEVVRGGGDVQVHSLSVLVMLAMK